MLGENMKRQVIICNFLKGFNFLILLILEQFLTDLFIFKIAA